MKKIFITYSREDIHLLNLIRAQLAQDNSLEFSFMEIQKYEETIGPQLYLDPDDISWMSLINESLHNNLKDSSIVLSLVSNSYSELQIFEISAALNKRIPVFGILTENVYNEQVLKYYQAYNIPLYKWTFRQVISLIHGQSKSLDYKLTDEKLIQSPIIRIDFEKVSNELTKYFLTHPDAIHKLEPRKYEEYIAYLLDKLGYEITLTQQTRDNGVDIFALKKDELGNFLTIVDCKKYAINRSIGIGVVRTLYGTMNIEKASHGIIATTSTFTKEARAFEEKYKYQISLKDHHDIYGWIEKVDMINKG